jgi:hypothetical protein
VAPFFLNSCPLGVIQVPKHAAISGVVKDFDVPRIAHFPFIVEVSRRGLHSGQTWFGRMPKSFCFRYHRNDLSTS